MSVSEVPNQPGAPTAIDPSACRWAYCLWGLVVAGIILRVLSYLANRSLWLDETSLALSIVPRGFAELARPLGFNQQASLGFRWLLKWATLAISPDAYGLRFVPMLSGVLSVPVLALVARRMLRPIPAVIAVAFFALNPWLIAYASEGKAYGIEVLSAALTTWLTLRVMDQIDPMRRLVTLALATGTLVWLGAGAIFAVGGAWIVLTLWVLTHGQSRRIQIGCVVCGAIVLTSTLMSLWASWLKPDVMAFQIDAWANLDAFPPPIWAGWRSAAWYPPAIMRFLRQTEETGSFSATILALAFLLIGAVAIWRRRAWQAALLLAPAGLVLMAGIGHKYPLVGVEWPAYLPSSARLVLFLTPAMSILIAAGVGRVGAIASPWGPLAGAVLLAILAANPVVTDIKRAIWPPGFVDMRSAWQAIATRMEAGDALYVSPGATNALVYYAQLYPASARFPWFTGTKSADITNWLDHARARGLPIGHLWVVLVWYVDPDQAKLPEMVAKVEQAITQHQRTIQHKESMDFADIHVCDYTLGDAGPR